QTSPVHLEVRDLGPGPGDAQPPPGQGCDRSPGLLLRPRETLAAWLQRKHQRPAPPVLPEGNRPSPARRCASRLRRCTTESPTSRNPRLDTSRRSPRPITLDYVPADPCCADRLNPPRRFPHVLRKRCAKGLRTKKETRAFRPGFLMLFRLV